MSPLMAFLSHAVLESGEGQAEEWEDCVQMMTLHSAKGLEFPIVFLCGMEDGLFPHQRSVTDMHGLEEERRLCYVGVTRAMRQLYCTYAEQRRMHGVDSYGAPSRFLAELPAELVEEVRPKVNVSRPAYMPQSGPIHAHRPGPARSNVSMSGRRFQDDVAGRPQAGPACAARQVRGRRRAEHRRPGRQCPGPDQFRAPGHEVADDGLRPPRGRLRRAG